MREGRLAPETNLPSPFDRRNKFLLVVIGADVVTVLPSAVWKSESLRGKSRSYREGDTCKQHFQKRTTRGRTLQPHQSSKPSSAL